MQITITMNATTNKTAKKATKLQTAACELFGVPADRIPAVLYALGFREACGRCLGSGRYSYCQMYGDRCFGCSGKGMLAAKLTATVLEAARVKVEAGELETLRAARRELVAAKKSLAGLVARAGEIAKEIGNAYTAYSMSHDSADTVTSPIFRAQGLNNWIVYGGRVQGIRCAPTSISDIESDVRFGKRTDYVACKAEIEAAIVMLETLRAEWRLFNA